MLESVNRTKIDMIKASLMSLFGSIIDQRQDYKGFLIIHLMMVPWLYYDVNGLWTSLTDKLIV